MTWRKLELWGSSPRSRRTTLLALALGLAGLGLFATSASASFHLMRIREVYPAGNASYVELQMLTSAENLVGGHHLVSYNTNGTVADDFTLPSNVNPGPVNTAILITGSGYTTAFPSGPSPDELDSSMSLSASGGAVCWVEGAPPDCVAWGNFTGPFPAHTPPLVAGNPASPSGVTAGKALRRTIAPGCPTLLEEGDDTDDSATDFSEQTPNPRNNASPVTETACSLATTTIDSNPANPTTATSAEFTYHATPAGAEFECKLDAAAYASCLDEGVEYPGPLAEGSHTFRVRAKNSVGTGAPAVYTWTIDLTPPTASINSQPVNPSSGASASFTYSSNEVNSTFECSLVEEGLADSFASCPPTGKTYTSLANGMYAFKVRATDKAGNQGSAAAYTWEVDNSLTDTTPPETTIDSRPADPSSSSTAAFTYSSNEPGSTFQCALDGAAFAACPPTGITYSGLTEGAHTFQVRAIDSSSNVDPSPAGYSFSVVLTPAVITPPPPPKPSINWKKRCRRIKNHKARKRCLRRHHVR
jgi:hypothetical protein